MSDEFDMEALGIDWLSGQYTYKKDRLMRELSHLEGGSEDE